MFRDGELWVVPLNLGLINLVPLVCYAMITWGGERERERERREKREERRESERESELGRLCQISLR